MRRPNRQHAVASTAPVDNGAQQRLIKLLLFGLLFVMIAAEAVSVLSGQAQDWFTNPLVTLEVEWGGQEKVKQKPVP